jgi:hypothetical protein
MQGPLYCRQQLLAASGSGLCLSVAATNTAGTYAVGCPGGLARCHITPACPAYWEVQPTPLSKQVVRRCALALIQELLALVACLTRKAQVCIWSGVMTAVCN